MADKYLVQIIESERGWDTKIIDAKHFDTLKEVEDFVTEFNKDYDFDGPVPDYYMIAQYVGKVS